MIWAGFTAPQLNAPEAIKALYDRPNTVVWEPGR
jgi:hypothetical protein